MRLELLGLLLACAIFFTLWLWRRRGRRPTHIDAAGVRFVRAPAPPLFLPWAEIERFGIATVLALEGGLAQPGSSQYLGILLAATSLRKSTPACADNRRLSGYDLLLTPDPGLSVAEFAALLESARPKSCSHPSASSLPS